jgi:hypothetical protein
VSGENVAFVLVLVGPVLRRLARVPRLAAALVVLVAFAAMTRFEPSVLRACAMGACSMLALEEPIETYVLTSVVESASIEQPSRRTSPAQARTAPGRGRTTARPVIASVGAVLIAEPHTVTVIEMDDASAGDPHRFLRFSERDTAPALA